MMYAPSGLRGMKQHAISESFEIRHLRHEMLQRRGLASQFPVPRYRLPTIREF